MKKGWERWAKENSGGKNQDMHESSCSRLNEMEAYEKRISPFDLEWDDTSQLPFPYMLPPNTHTHTQFGTLGLVSDGRSGAIVFKIDEARECLWRSSSS